MNLSMKQDQENNNAQNIIPLSSDEIKSILKSQSETVFEEKNISNNSDFVKKSLIDIALDFQSKENVQGDQIKKNTQEKTTNLKLDSETLVQEQKSQEEEPNEKNKDKNNIDAKSNAQPTENKIDEDTSFKNENKVDEEELSEKTVQDEKIKDVKSEIQLNENKTDEDLSDKYENKVGEEGNQLQKVAQEDNVTENTTIDEKHENDHLENTKLKEDMGINNETQQALDSVRDAVSQSINQIDNVSSKSLEGETKVTNSDTEKILKDYENFKNIFSSLSSLSETAINEVVKNKILEIAYELAGYQIDKMPEKYEKKIKSFLKNINCYENKIIIEVNEEDLQALNKITDFNKNKETKVFVSNKDLSRGDIILNCDGMRYSEKSIYNK